MRNKDNIPTDDEVLTPNEASPFLNVQAYHLRAAFRRNEIDSVIPGKWNRAPFAAYRAWVHRKPQTAIDRAAAEEEHRQRNKDHLEELHRERQQA